VAACAVLPPAGIRGAALMLDAATLALLALTACCGGRERGSWISTSSAMHNERLEMNLN
jgi:hypothetical protein